MSSQLLYDRWLATAQNRSSDLALIDSSTGCNWTFAQLQRAAEAFTVNETESMAFPSGSDAQFILRLLSAWRHGIPACPLEQNQTGLELREVPRFCAHVKITSATSGPPKSILFTAEQLAADAENIVATMGLRPEWPNLACISLAHSYGFSNLVLPLLFHGIPLVLVPAPLPEVVSRAAKQVEWITLPAVPALWKTWHEAGAIPSNLRLAISAGATLPLALEESIYATGVKIHNFYGSSECGGIAYDRTEVPRAEASFTGTALENVKLSVSRDGTLVITSGAVGETYWPEPHPALSKSSFQTADLVDLREGAVHLRGRLSDVLNIAGRKISPEAIEAALRRNPGIVDCVVFGIEDPESRGEAIVAAVELRDSMTIPELNRFLSEHLPGWQIPRHWWFTEQIAPNQRGKISRAEWKRRYQARHS